MSTGAKIAVGCGVALLLAVIATAVGMVGLGYWVKGKAEEIVGDQQRIDDLQKQADAYPFTRPADGVLREDRLLTFLEVRQAIFGVYERHQAALDAIKRKKQGDFGDLRKGFDVFNELRLAQAQALVARRMSQDEYRYHVEQVYRTLLAAEVDQQTGGKSVSEATSDAHRKAAEQVRRATEQAESADNLTPEQRKLVAQQRRAMADGAEALEQAGAELAEQARKLDVPPENIALFRKHEAAIRKYAMGGLELVGL